MLRRQAINHVSLSWEVVYTALYDIFFKVRQNVIYEHARFNRRNQQQGETTEQYITELYHFVENCEYSSVKDEMIRDRLHSCKHSKHVLSQQPQLEANLTLDEAKIKVQHREAVGEQQWELKVASGDSTSLEEIHSRRRFSGKKQSSVTDSKRRSGQILKETHLLWKRTTSP